jgi:hypothetical protein
MYKIDKCIACGSTNLNEYEAELHEFVVWRVTKTKQGHYPVTGLSCRDCGCTFSQSRLNDEEENLLYAGYREENYNQMREACEPGYIQNIATMLEGDGYLKRRQVIINKMISGFVDPASVKSVLDYGGDDGKHIPECFQSAKHYVYEISGIDLLEGIAPYSTKTNTEQVDFLMCCHVLEHRSEIDSLLEDIKKCVHKESWLYFEVPTEAIPRVFHEHINIFTSKSLAALLSRNGIEPMDLWQQDKLLGIIAKLK